MRQWSYLSRFFTVASLLFLPKVVLGQTRPVADPATSVRIQELPKRFKQIKPGMTKQQVWKTLGLPMHGIGFGGRGSGTRQAFSSVYWVGSYNLGLVFDDSLKPSRLKSATLIYNPSLQPVRRKSRHKRSGKQQISANGKFID